MRELKPQIRYTPAQRNVLGKDADRDLLLRCGNHFRDRGEKMTAAERVLELTVYELTKLDEIQRACPALEAQLVSRGDGYLIFGYPQDRETPARPPAKIDAAKSETDLKKDKKDLSSIPSTPPDRKARAESGGSF